MKHSGIPGFVRCCSVVFFCVRYFRHLNHIINKFDSVSESSFLVFSCRGLSFSFWIYRSTNANHVIPRRSLWLHFMIKSFRFWIFFFLSPSFSAGRFHWSVWNMKHDISSEIWKFASWIVLIECIKLCVMRLEATLQTTCQYFYHVLIRSRRAKNRFHFLEIGPFTLTKAFQRSKGQKFVSTF